MITTTTRVAVSNAEQAAAWNGREGSYWAAHHEAFETALARYQPAFLSAAAIQRGDRVLDVGCGTGVSTRAAALLASEGGAFGVDLSSEMIAVARRLAERAGLTNVRFEHVDAQVHAFEAEDFDIAISRTGAMFFGDPAAAFVNLRRSLRPNGRLVLLTWQRAELQEWARAFTEALSGRTPPAPVPGAPGPFSLSDPDYTRTLLEGAGFTEVELTAVSETTTYGRTVEAAHAFLLGLFGWMLDGQDPSRRAASIEALRATLAAHETDDGVRFGSAAWLVTARRP
jgi:SAM-dependent methyltransferase